MKKILVTGGNGRFANELKKIKNSYKFEFRNKKQLNILSIKSIDEGIGMSSSVKDKIFDKFFRETKGNIHDVKGHGLGLSYVKKIVDLHNGMIYVDSKLGKGTTFLIKLPVIS